MATVQLYSAEDWKNGLRHAIESGKRLVFVVGAGLSRDKAIGAWGVGQVLEHVKRAYPRARFSEDSPATAYQDALGAVMANYSSDDVEKTIRHAVLAAAKEGEGLSKARSDLEQSRDSRVPASCRDLQSDPTAWNLPKGVVALAELLAYLNERARKDPTRQYPCVLSTNFDGLVEAALATHGIRCEPTVVGGNEFPKDIGQRLSVVHVHGYWLSEPTLHDPMALEARRDSLEAALRGLLQGSAIFVLGYGGWNDIVFGTATTMLQRQQASLLPEVKWAFYSPKDKVQAEADNPMAPCGHVIKHLAETARTSFYCGVNVHEHLPQVVEAVVGRPLPHSSVDVAGVSTFTSELVRLLRVLLATVPKRMQDWFVPLQAEAEAGRPVNLAAVVAACCTTLEEGRMAGPEHRAFAEAAWDLVTFMVGNLVGTMKGSPVSRVPPDKLGEILTVPVRTHFFVALLLAKNPDPRRIFEPGPFAPVSPQDHSQKARFVPMETGPSQCDRVFDFESLLWKDLFPTAPPYSLGCKEPSCGPTTCALDCDRRPLYGRLAADRDRGRPHFWVIDPREAQHWQKIAAQVRDLVFVQPGVGATVGIDEDRLAILVSDFLKLSASKETP
jgi:hypothetical protein